MDKSIAQRFEEAAQRSDSWLEEQLTDKGSFGPQITDLASYYKAPYLFYMSGKTEYAVRSLRYIEKQYMRDNGDFAKSKQLKTEEPFLAEFANYINGWLALSAQKIGRFEVAVPAFQYLRLFYHPEEGGFITQKPYGEGDDAMDVFSTAHLGLVSLYFGDVNKAKRAGNFLQRCLSMQPDVSAGFYLRIGGDGRYVTTFPDEAANVNLIHTNQPSQHYFMLGYVVGFLGKLYNATKDQGYLMTAKSYMEILNKCDDSLYVTRLSNQVGWGAAVLANISKEKRFINVAIKIGDWLVEDQGSDGTWASDSDASTKFDATIENAIWLREIVSELSTL